MNHCNDLANLTGASEGSAEFCQMNENMNANHVSLRGKKNNCKNRQESGCFATQRPSSTVITPEVAPRTHQRRWSIDLSKFRTSNVLIQKKKKEPKPPLRSVSLLQPEAKSNRSKRYSCPPTGISTLTGHSSSSSTSSCSSPPAVKTSVITGHDPLGWKLRAKSSDSASKARTNRFSLQIVLPAIPDPDPPKPAPSTIAKPTRRHHSDTSALIASVEALMPVVTLEDLRAVKLHSAAPPHESDNVFAESTDEDEKKTDQPRKIPPPVPEKTAMARQIAQLISSSNQRWRAKPKQDENIYASLIKLRPKTPRAGQ